MGGAYRDPSSPPPYRGVTPRRAPVTPRVRPADGGEVLPIEDRIAAVLRRNRAGVVTLCGPAGSGKTTALEHLLTAIAPDAPVVAFDDVSGRQGWSAVERAASSSLVVVSSPEACPLNCIAHLATVPWGDDDVIEYLLATHRPQCQAVMFKIKSFAQHLPLDGSPELWRMVLDTMAGDDSIPDVPAALRSGLASLLSDPSLLTASLCLAMLRDEDLGNAVKLLDRIPPRVRRLIQHRPVQIALASELLVRNLCDGTGWSDLDGQLPHDLVIETARLAAHWPAVVERLSVLIAGNKRRVHPMAASLLLAIRPDWRPPPNKIPALSGAYVAGAHWAGVDLHGGSIAGADLERADLSEANLIGVSGVKTVLREASLCNARLDKFAGTGSVLSGSRLVGASAERAMLRDADLRAADLRSANLCGTDLTNADLTDAVLSSAKLCRAELDHTKLAGADLVGVDLSSAKLRHVSLCDVNLAGACFEDATFLECDLEGLALPKGKFGGARLAGAYLTGSFMPEADFSEADLRNTGLADVDWEGADLRDADLRGASFHMGSTRSGLVGSSIPCEGSKTGFYTDDFQDREFKDPEEIRKANLAGADLRGAKIDGVDFYLVDLRGAIFSDRQREHFVRCRAILD